VVSSVYKFNFLLKDVLAKSMRLRITDGRSFEWKIRMNIKNSSLWNTVSTLVCNVKTITQTSLSLTRFPVRS
jgi:hypothetical protein